MTHKLMLTLLTGIGLIAAIVIVASNSTNATPANVGGTVAIAIIALALTAGSGFFVGFARNLQRQGIFSLKHVFFGVSAMVASWAYIMFNAFVPAQPIRSMLHGEYFRAGDGIRINLLAVALALLIGALLYGTATLVRYLLRRGKDA